MSRRCAAGNHLKTSLVCPDSVDSILKKFCESRGLTMVPLLCDAEITHDALPDSGTMPVYLALARAHERTAHSLDTQTLNVVPLAADNSDALNARFQAAIGTG